MAKDSVSPSSVKGPELVIGLVGPVGVDLGSVESALTDALEDVYYKTTVVHLTELLSEFEAFSPYPSDLAVDERYQKLMDMGNEFRRRLGRGDAMALLAASTVRELRLRVTGSFSIPQERHAYIVHQLKHPAEADALRRIYGRSFILLAAYASRDHRVQYLATRIADERSEGRSASRRSDAEVLISRDENERELDLTSDRLGQNVRDLFPLADVFVNVMDRDQTRAEIRRFVRALFDYPVCTPSRDEQGMFFAKAAALRSASLARQVGAAVCSSEGEVVAVGTNEVPKAGGGLYWEGDDADARDFVNGRDVSDDYKRRLVAELLTALRDSGWLSSKRARLAVVRLVTEALYSSPAVLRNTRIMDLLEFVRAVHAEMAAISAAARAGKAVDGHTLYVTTFPCHECARQIVAAGIARVVFIEPYPKSLATELYPEAVGVEGEAGIDGRVLFKPFVGIAPRRYLDLFEMRRQRKKPDGTLAPWDPLTALPKLPSPYPLYIPAEQAEDDLFQSLLEEKTLRRVRARAKAVQRKPRRSVARGPNGRGSRK